MADMATYTSSKPANVSIDLGGSEGPTVGDSTMASSQYSNNGAQSPGIYMPSQSEFQFVSASSSKLFLFSFSV